jgi:hypothetical protein
MYVSGNFPDYPLLYFARHDFVYPVLSKMENYLNTKAQRHEDTTLLQQSYEYKLSVASQPVLFKPLCKNRAYPSL